MELAKKNLNPLVSIVVNCFNGGEYLEKCLSSILAQTYQNWELVFWDNASDDNSADIFLSYKDFRFRYFASETNVSLGQARKWAVEKCRGEYLSFLDIDDYWFPEKTEIQVREMLKDNYVLSYGGIIKLDESTQKSQLVKPRYKSGYLFSANMYQFEINMPSAMIKKSSLLSKGLNFDESIKASEEYCLFMQLIYKEKVCVIPEPLAIYLIRTDSLTNAAMEYWSYERMYTLSKIKERNPMAHIEFRKEFHEASNRAIYYKLRYNLEIGNITEARENANLIWRYSYRYFALTLMVYLFPRNFRRLLLIYYKR